MVDTGLTRRASMLTAGALALTGMAPLNLAAVERLAGGRLGFAVLDTANGRIIGHRMDERFAMCSTFKLPLAGLILQAADRGRLSLGKQIPVTRADMLAHAPVTAGRVGGSMTIAELAEAAQVTSDNVAANLLIRELGGPAGVTRLLRELGDKVTRLDRWEPEMNLVVKGDPRDTTTPRAAVLTTEKLVLGDALQPAARSLLVGWMVKTTTGKQRLRAVLPRDWKVGDKTGTGLSRDMPNRINDIAVIWPPKRAPLVVAGFYEAPGAYPDVRPRDEAVLAEAMWVVMSEELEF